MAIYRLSMSPLSRSAGRSATASAAYRSGTKIHDQRTGMTWDFTRRTGVEHAEIVLPSSASDAGHWARDRSALWNAAELIEKRKDARTAREYGLALPHEFTRAQQIELVRRFSLELARRYQVGVDFAIHLPHWHGDDRNIHAHVLATTRQVTATGLGEKAAMEWSDTNLAKAGLGSTKKQLVSLRVFWADIQNEKFKELGMAIRVDHRTLAAQGIDRQPTSHLGPAVSAMHRQGMQTRVGQRIAQEQRQAAAQRALGWRSRPGCRPRCRTTARPPRRTAPGTGATRQGAWAAAPPLRVELLVAADAQGPRQRADERSVLVVPVRP